MEWNTRYDLHYIHAPVQHGTMFVHILYIVLLDEQLGNWKSLKERTATTVMVATEIQAGSEGVKHSCLIQTSMHMLMDSNDPGSVAVPLLGDHNRSLTGHRDQS